MEDFNGILLKFKTIKINALPLVLVIKGKNFSKKQNNVGLVYCYDHNYCILIVCTLHITVVCHDGNNSAPRHFLPILNSFSPSGVPRTVPAEDRKPMLHIRPDDKLSQVGISKLKIAIRPACLSSY